MNRLGRILGTLIALGMTAVMIGGLGIIIIFYHFSKDLPDYSQLANYEPPIVTRLYAGDGKLLAEYATQRRVYVPLSAMPKRLVQAFLSAEDQNFYSHGGVDFKGVMRAAVKNFINLGTNRSLVGGSTITQQVVKNFLLTKEKSFDRKIKEAILAFRITRTYSKDRILELYLNQIYLGGGSYGVAAAALNYFNKSMDELTVEEAAFLAALPKAPANYNPKVYYERAKARRDWVIGRMLADGYITDDEAKQAQAMPIVLRARDQTEVTQADFFAEEVRRELAEMYGPSVLYEGGLTVKTTLAPDLQEIADASLRKALIDYDRRWGYRGAIDNLASLDDWQKQLEAIAATGHMIQEDQHLAVVLSVRKEDVSIGLDNGGRGLIPFEEMAWAKPKTGELSVGPAPTSAADVVHPGDVVLVQKVAEKDDTYALMQVPEVNGALVAMDPHTGRILALSGGYAYGKTEFNRATQAKRQPGSAFKPFVYLSGMESGLTPSSIVLDAPVEMSQGAGLPVWRPQNYKDEYFGPTTLRTGLEKSRNTMTVRLAQMIGIDKILSVAKRFRIYDPNQPRHFSIVLGAAETTLLRLTNAYAMLVNGGKRIQPAMIERIDDRNGKAIYRRDMRACEGCRIDTDLSTVNPIPPIPPDDRDIVVDARVAYQMVSMLQGVVERGTATKAKVIGKPLAGKTGTTNDSFDTWFIGFSPDLVCGVFVGFDSPRSLGKRETGGSVALPGFVSFMSEALKDQPSTPFRIPPGIQLLRIDRTTGQPTTINTPAQNAIFEAYVTGGPIYIPKTPEEEAEQQEGVVREDVDAVDPTQQTPVDSQGMDPHMIMPSTEEAPEQGTGGLY